MFRKAITLPPPSEWIATSSASSAESAVASPLDAAAKKARAIASASVGCTAKRGLAARTLLASRRPLIRMNGSAGVRG